RAGRLGARPAPRPAGEATPDPERPQEPPGSGGQSSRVLRARAPERPLRPAPPPLGGRGRRAGGSHPGNPTGKGTFPRRGQRDRCGWGDQGSDEISVAGRVIVKPRTRPHPHDVFRGEGGTWAARPAQGTRRHAPDHGPNISHRCLPAENLRLSSGACPQGRLTKPSGTTAA